MTYYDLSLLKSLALLLIELIFDFLSLRYPVSTKFIHTKQGIQLEQLKLDWLDRHHRKLPQLYG